MRSSLVIATLTALLTAACGTAVFEHRFEVTVSDPTGRLGAGPVEVSVFDKIMGYSEGWARQTMGVATASRPYSGTVGAQGAGFIWGTPLPANVVAGLAIPAVETSGYFVLDIKPVRGAAQAASLPFARYDAFFPEEGSRVPPLAVRYEAEPADKGWRIRLTVEVPAKR